jgi:hypothetical protein
MAIAVFAAPQHPDAGAKTKQAEECLQVSNAKPGMDEA